MVAKRNFRGPIWTLTSSVTQQNREIDSVIREARKRRAERAAAWMFFFERNTLYINSRNAHKRIECTSSSSSSSCDEKGNLNDR
jgi:hypothetical protein